MSAQHTPGPWLIDGADKAFVYAMNEQGYNRFWAHVQGGNTAPMEHTTAEELSANARLIAAAPELLEVLQEAFDRPSITEGHEWWSRAAKAVAKATGEAS